MKKKITQIVALCLTFMMILSSCNVGNTTEEITTTSDVTTEATTEVTTEVSTEVKTEVTTEITTENPTEPVTDPITEEPTIEVATTEAPTTEEPTTEEPTTEEPTTEEPTTEEPTTEEPTTEPPTECSHEGGVASCTEKAICEKCGDAYGELDDNAHTEVTREGTDATCVDSGLTDGKYCSACNKITVAQEIISAKGHKYDNDEDAECNICGFTRDVSCKHTVTEIIPAVEAKCLTGGLTEGKRCTKCGEITVTQVATPAKGHTEVKDPAVEATCTSTGLTEGKHCSICDTVTVKQTITSMKPHSEVIDPAVASTCTSTGLTEGKHCSVCGTITVKQIETIKKSHKEVIDPAVEATCTATGLTEGKHCSTCGKVMIEQTTISAKGHSLITLDAVSATCTATGLTEGKKCTVCQTVTVEQTTISAKGHSLITLDAVSATCTTTGLTEGKKCTVCQTVTVEQTTTSALGHNYVNNVCSRCGDTKDIPPVDVPAEAPVKRTEHSPYEYFTCASCGYISYTDGTSKVGNVCFDFFKSQDNTTNYLKSGYTNGMTVTLTQSQSNVWDIKGWVCMDLTNFEMGWSIGSDDLRWYGANESIPEAAVYTEANKAGFTNARRFYYYLGGTAFNSGETVHFLIKDKDTGLIYCFAEIVVVKPSQKNNVYFGSLDHAKHQTTNSEYKTSMKTPGSTVTIKENDGIIEMYGWLATNIADYSLVWRLNEELREGNAGGYKIAPSGEDATAIAKVASSKGYSYYTRYKYYLPPAAISSGDMIHLYLKDNSTGELYLFASYKIIITDNTANYTLLNTVSKVTVDNTTLTAPNEDASVKLWFDHLTEKVARYDTSGKDSGKSSYTIQMARNEMEGCHFYLFAPTNRKITIKISDFTNEYGETLKTELGVEFYIEDGYIPYKGFTIGQTSASGNKVDVYPDAVVPYDSYVKSGFGGDEGGSYEYGEWVPIGPYSYKPWDTAAYPYRDTVRGFVVQATTEKDSRPGKYSATVEIYDYETGKCIKQAMVYTQVYNVVMAEETALDTYIGVWNEYYIQTYNNYGGYNDSEVIRALADFMLEYRLTPSMGGWVTENVLGVEWLYNPRVTTIRVADKATYDKYKNDPVLASKMVYYGQDEPGAPRNQYRPLKLADGSSVTYFDAFGILSILGVAEEANMLKSWGWNDYRLLIPIERNADFDDFSTYPDLGQTGTIPGMSWAAIEAQLKEQGAKDLYNKYKTEIQNSDDMIDFLSNYVSLWVYVYTGSTPRILSNTSGCRYMQSAAHDAVYGEFYERMKAYKAQGDEIWGYVACEPQWHSPYQNILLFNDGTEGRTMFWTSYMLGQTGWLYWREDYYGASNTNTYAMRVPFSTTGPGDGILVYPGAIYGQVDPIPSIRFMNMRDGVEDYQLLCMIEEKYGEAKAQELVANIVTSTVTFTRDDNKLYDVHAELLKLLEAAN